ncbi:NADPH:quinone reductase [Rossellomorea vietnamensis]|uniref:Zinc-binding dehydrogenase n=1 Tax=Rossellomorea vietnamensis TaxID=218284 RepID=A0A0P6WDQ8_9BACI|nr:NADPH:quinone reductase [Rossellomorea vietnamensis]KPL58359.1 zinc-binding dehydrogenase [Rossellomorea vietnamensis]
MKAAWFSEFGSASEVLQIGEVDKPAPSHGEVLIRMHTSGVNPSDTKKRLGSLPDLLDKGSVTPNSDGAGIIDAVGAGVPHSRIGERVWVYQAQYGRLHGTAAEYVSIESNRAVPLPENTSFVEGACLGIPAMTAHRSVFSDGPVEGQWLLITGGAGRVGHYAIQWAKQGGAKVIATASNEAARQHCVETGADYVVDHRSDGMVDEVLEMTGGVKVDRVIDVEFGANLPRVLELIRIGGVIATYSSTVVPEPTLPFRDMMFMDLTLRMIIVYAMPESAKQAAIEDITEALKNDRLQHRIAETYTLDEIAEANQKIEDGGFYGCVVVEVE